MTCVANILDFAKNLNAKSNYHFPVLAVSYGYLALLGTNSDNKLEDMPQKEYVQKLVKINLVHEVKDTYLYDGKTLADTENMLD